MAKFCSSCGAQLQETSKFCRECGTRVDPPAAPVSSSALPSAPVAPASASQSAHSPAARPVPADSAPVSEPAPNPAAPASKPQPALNRLSQNHKPQDGKAKPAKSACCLRGCAAAFVIMLLIAGIGALFTVCQPEEPPKPYKTGSPIARRDKPSKPGRTGSPAVRPYTPPKPQKTDKPVVRPGSPSEPYDTGGTVGRRGTPNPEASSAAFTREIQKGVVLSVPENALGNRKLVVKPVAEPSELLQTADKQLRERGIFSVAAWEVDAGLAEDERLPGYYSLRVDLGELGIDESLYNRVRFYRLTEKGELFEYCTAVDGRTVSFSSNQNSFVLAAIGMVAVGLPIVFSGAGYVAEYREEVSYYCSREGDNWYIECPTNAQPFKLFWNSNDVDKDFYSKDFYEKVDKLTKRQNEIIYEVKVKHEGWLGYVDYASGRIFGFADNADIAKAVQEALDKDAEFQKLRKQVKRFPPYIEKNITQITTAYDYLGKTVKVKMPGYTVCFYLKKGLSALGYQNSTLFRNPYIEIKIQSDMIKSAQKGGEQWDNLLLTVTHELFHICQEEYHFRYGVSSKKFDEMVTVVLEADARDYYKGKRIITTNPESLIEGTFEKYFYFPMDGNEEGDPGEYGYALAKFVKFIRQNRRTKINARHLMDAREYYSKPNISDPLMKCFGISKSKLGDYFAAYCKSNFIQVGDSVANCESEQLIIQPSQPVPASLKFSGPFSCRAKTVRFQFGKTAKRDCAVLIVPQTNDAQTVLCGDPRVNTSYLERGIFMPSQKDVPVVGTVMMIFLPGEKKTLKTGLTAYAIPAPDFKELKAGSGYIRLKVPKISAAGRDGLTDGFLVGFKAGDLPGKIVPIEPDKAGKTIELKLSQVFPQAQPGELKFTAVMREYVLDKDGKRCLCPESQRLSASAVIPEAEGNKGDPGKHHYIYVPKTFSVDGAQVSRKEMISKRKAHINDLIKGWKKKLAEEKEVRNPDDRTRSRIAKWQRSIERDRKTLHNYDDPDWVNFSFGNPLSVSRSRDGAQISGITLLMSRSGSVWNRSIYFKAVNSGSGGGSFTGEDPRGEHGRVSVKLPLGGGSGSLSYDGREYDVFEYDEETYDKYIKMTR